MALGEEEEQAFNKLKHHITTAPIPSYPDSVVAYELHTEASEKKVIC